MYSYEDLPVLPLTVDTVEFYKSGMWIPVPSSLTLWSSGLVSQKKDDRLLKCALNTVKIPKFKKQQEDSSRSSKGCKAPPMMRQKKLPDLKRRLEGILSRWIKVMLKVSPYERVECFGNREKLNPRNVGPFKELEKEIIVRRVNQKEYAFKEADFPRLHLDDIEDMYLPYA
ncbi:hypothetical protein Tco_0008144 [Tanacetum coccineum]